MIPSLSLISSKVCYMSLGTGDLPVTTRHGYPKTRTWAVIPDRPEKEPKLVLTGSMRTDTAREQQVR
jgi:hypothetical protein